MRLKRPHSAERVEEDMNEPIFDEVITAYVHGRDRDIVMHRNAEVEVFAFHSPLERGPIRCEICETPGSRVYITE